MVPNITPIKAPLSREDEEDVRGVPEGESEGEGGTVVKRVVTDMDTEEEGVAEVGVVAEVDVGDNDVGGVVVVDKESDEGVAVDGVGVDAGDVRPP
jgi:hypothetical protein